MVGNFVMTEHELLKKKLTPDSVGMGSYTIDSHNTQRYVFEDWRGSIRMETVFMILGQSAATAAVMAVEKGIAVQDLEYDELEAKLLEDKKVLDYEGRIK